MIGEFEVLRALVLQSEALTLAAGGAFHRADERAGLGDAAGADLLLGLARNHVLERATVAAAFIARRDALRLRLTTEEGTPDAIRAAGELRKLENYLAERYPLLRPPTPDVVAERRAGFRLVEPSEGVA